ncbi:flocculation protein FLO11-like, partial [Trifolium medium]|nr:flocculation protein FLO11-like [Trifolium medium]
TAAAATATQNTSTTLSVPQSNNTNAENGNFSTPTISVSNRKRKDTSTTVDAPSIAKRSRGRSSTTSRKIPVKGQNTLPQSNCAVNHQVVYHPSCATQSSALNCVPNGSQVQGSSVVKCLFNQSRTSIPTNSQVPKTPPRTNSSHGDTNISPPEVTQVAASNVAAASTCYTVISTKRVM